MTERLPAVWLVVWNDAHLREGPPAKPGDIHCVQRSIGWRVKSPRGYVQIAQSYCEGDLIDCLTIPTAMVRSITVLRGEQVPPPKPRSRKK